MYNGLIKHMEVQKYLELVNQGVQTDPQGIAKQLRLLKKMFPAEEMDKYTDLINKNEITQHPDFKSWSIEKGRLDFFNRVKRYMKQLWTRDEELERRNCP